MRGSGKRKSWIMYTILAITIVIGLVFASGCADVFFGSQKLGDFGSSVNEQQAVNCFIGKYGDPQTNAGPARFLEPMITTGLVNNTPVDTVMKLNKDTPKVTFWVFYDNFAKGDDLELKWTYLVSGKDVMTLHQQAGGDFGRAFAEFLKPDSGWPTGQHKISISGKGATAYVTIEVIDSATVTGTLPCSQEGATIKREEGKTKVVKYDGSPPQAILSYITDKTKTQGVAKIPTPSVGTQYEIYVHTGDVEGAGTDSDVWITIFAEGGKTEWIKLDNAEDNFETGKVDDFYFFSPDIGELREINLSISCFEHCSMWWLASIFVVNTRTNQAWVFPYNRNIQPHEKTYYFLIPGYRWTEWPYDTDSPASTPTTPQGSMTPTPTPPLVVPLHTTPTIVYACWTQPKILTPTLIISLNPTPTPTTVPTTPQVIHLNITPTTPIPRYKGSSI